MKKVIITTGGTGGHIYPALAVAKELKNNNVEVIFVGSKSRMESKIVPEEGIKFIGIRIFPFNSIKNIVYLFRALIKAVRIIIKEKPDAVIGFGNYISVPILFAAFILRKKIYLQEQNAELGFANKLFYRFSKKLFVAFDSTFDEVPLKYNKKVMVTGNPLRREIENLNRETEREKLGIKNNERVLLIMGGSLGAQDINEAIIAHWNKINDDENIKIYWSTGEKSYDSVMKYLKNINPKNTVKPYFKNILEIMTASDLVLGRAGALSISEIIELEKPSVLIPFPSAKVGQYENAKILEQIGASFVYKNNLANDAIKKVLEILTDEKELHKMSAKLKDLKRPNAAETIVKEMQKNKK